MDITLGETRYLMFTTRAFASGIPTVLAGTPIISAYENNNVTQITAGITLGVSHDSVVGMNLITVVATGANGFEAGKDYNFVITTGTVSSVSVVGEVVGTLSIDASAALKAVDLLNDVAATDIVSSGAITTSGGAVSTVTTTGTTTTNTDMRGTDSANTVVPPSVSQFNARTILAAAYFDPAADTVANVTTVATTTTNTDMRGTDSAATATNLATVDTNVDAILVDTGTTIPAQITALNDVAATDIVSSGAITTSSGAVSNVTLVATTTDLTNAGSVNVTQIAGSTTAATQLALSTNTIVAAAAATGTLSTTQMTTTLTETTDDHYIGRIIIWTSGSLANQATDITDYTGSTKLLTFTAVTEAPSNSDTFIIV